ncbi:hypothetical protein LB505_007912 [Fusarium chuoi]|nr:hypothetical protein LB505_007912 [Fusarium chuoi]
MSPRDGHFGHKHVPQERGRRPDMPYEQQMVDQMSNMDMNQRPVVPTNGRTSSDAQRSQGEYGRPPATELRMVMEIITMDITALESLLQVALAHRHAAERCLWMTCDKEATCRHLNGWTQCNIAPPLVEGYHKDLRLLAVTGRLPKGRTQLGHKQAREATIVGSMMTKIHTINHQRLLMTKFTMPISTINVTATLNTDQNPSTTESACRTSMLHQLQGNEVRSNSQCALAMNSLSEEPTKQLSLITPSHNQSFVNLKQPCLRWLAMCQTSPQSHRFHR